MQSPIIDISHSLSVPPIKTHTITMQLFIVCCATAVFAAVAVADTLPASNGGFGNGFARQVEDDSLTGPYAPSGWQPDGPQLQLPTREYGAPADVGGGSVEVSEQTVLFAGQSVSTELVPATVTVSSRYLPATRDAVVAGQVCMHLAHSSGCVPWIGLCVLLAASLLCVLPTNRSRMFCVSRDCRWHRPHHSTVS